MSECSEKICSNRTISKTFFTRGLSEARASLPLKLCTAWKYSISVASPEESI